MKSVLRLVTGAIGALALLLAARLWLAPADAAARLGITAMGGLGLATIRADMAGFFGAAGILAAAAAWQNRARLLTAPLIMVAIALSGRILTYLGGAHDANMIQPMAVEAVLVALFAAGRLQLRD